MWGEFCYPVRSSLDISSCLSARHKNHWSRAVIHSFSEDKQQLNLRLVDEGRFVEVSAGEVTSLPEKFLSERGLAFWCHLEAVILSSSNPDKILSDVMKEVRSNIRYVCVGGEGCGIPM